MLTFQQIIQRLTEFWEKKKCIIHQGHDVEVGAGTFNPSTFLRCLGPESYNTAYVEPCRRPSDGRYGENPNRLQLFHQFQVIMKPSPSDIQQLYLDSLQALGLDLKKHDIRFVHDDWESPTVGAWGLGWEVWCDGMEITQFTYFQAMGSLSLHPVSVELTYGLERLAMFIQNKDSIYAVKWNDELTFGDISQSNEVEWSTYNFEAASISMWKTHFEDFEREAKALIAKALPLPAYDFVIKASHAFNMLNARGAISVTERTGYIARIRDLSRLIATAYVESREKLGFPLLKQEKPVKLKKSAAIKKAVTFNPKKKQDFLLEIGSEQLPATFVPIGVTHLEKGIKQFLDKHRLSFDSIELFGTPQRLSVIVKGLVEGTAQTETERRGPALTSAFDAQGIPSPQGLGFLKSMGISDVTLEGIRKKKYKQLKVGTLKDVEYLFATLTEPSQSTFSLLSQELPALITHLEFPKKMRWGSSDLTYARPLHWIVALFGDKVIPFQVGEILSDRFSFGHAQLKRHRFALKSPDVYLKELKKHCVLADIEERKASILKQLNVIEKRCKGQALEIDKVLSQVLHLVEWPQLTIGSFDPRFLQAPKEVLSSEMVEHQKYFPLADSKGKLKNQFVITADNNLSDLIRRGNERVLSARLSDGVFLYEQDVKIPLEEWNKKLQLMTHQKALGSMFDKVERLKEIAETVRRQLKIGTKEEVSRAALLSKADLASSLVGEFPELQGIVGKYYAIAQQETQSVAEALEEQWMPRFEGAPLPQTATGTVLSFADKIDNLIGCYSVGLKPSSSSDPYALRRQVIGIIKTLIQQRQKVNLKALLEEACEHFPKLTGQKEVIDKIVSDILYFITARAQGVFEELGFKKDEIEASLQGQCLDPYNQFCKIEALHTVRKSGKEFSKLVEVYKRAKGQLEKVSSVPFNPSLTIEKAEKELIQAVKNVEKEWKSLLEKSDYVKAFKLVSSLHAPLAKLFDEVKILCEDIPVRNNRIALLQVVFNLFKELIDFSKIQEA